MRLIGLVRAVFMSDAAKASIAAIPDDISLIASRFMDTYGKDWERFYNEKRRFIR